MNTFAKILLVVVLTVVALKFSPLLLLGALIGLVAATVLGAVGLSLVAVLLAILLAFGVALSPIWVPVLIVMGLVSLFRSPQRQVPPATPA